MAGAVPPRRKAPDVVDLLEVLTKLASSNKTTAASKNEENVL